MGTKPICPFHIVQGFAVVGQKTDFMSSSLSSTYVVLVKQMLRRTLKCPIHHCIGEYKVTAESLAEIIE